jgi:hypothetical protein
MLIGMVEIRKQYFRGERGNKGCEKHPQRVEISKHHGLRISN